MKKYLILCAVAILASCSTEVETIDQKAREEMFESNFNSTFGVTESTYANHDWGMNMMPLAEAEDYSNIKYTADSADIIYLTDSIHSLDSIPLAEARGAMTRGAATRSATTRAANVNGNMWYQDWSRPTNVTAEEIAWAKAEFGKVRYNRPWVSINWPNYWVQQVYKGEQQYWDWNGSNIGWGSNQMNNLQAFNSRSRTVLNWWPLSYIFGEAYEHVNNFNAGNNTTTYTDDVTHQQYIGTTLMTDMATNGRTDQFVYYNSIDSKWHSEYIVLEHNGSYFIGFDFYADGPWYNKNQNVDRDYKYDDWIIKITPAVPANAAPSVERIRVMCEDLSGSRSDFDYNDVVFDVKFIKSGNKYYADIILQAIGGELPLYVGNYEVHGKFGVSTGTMVNTYEGRHSEVSPVQFTVELPDGTYNNAFEAINALPVYVRTSTSQTPIQLTTNPGQSAEMIAVPVSTDWPDERESIRNRYPAFVDWISDSSVVWYE